jgi:hypothetical protein
VKINFQAIFDPSALGKGNILRGFSVIFTCSTPVYLFGISIKADSKD